MRRTIAQEIQIYIKLRARGMNNAAQAKLAQIGIRIMRAALAGVEL